MCGWVLARRQLGSQAVTARMHAQELRCVLYDYDALDKDDEIGEAKLAVADLKNQEEKDVWLDVEEMTPDGPSQHKVSLACSMMSGNVRATRFWPVHRK